MKKKLLLLLLLIFVPFIKVNAADISYSSHVQYQGWKPFVSNGAMSGTEGLGLRLEGIKIKVDNTDYDGGISYSTHVQYQGWKPFVSDGAMSGTEGLGLRLEAIKIKLTGELAEHYSVFYRVHVQYQGWRAWVKNGELAGTTGLGLRLEGIEIKIVSNEPSNASVSYSAHSSDGWSNYVSNGEIMGTTGVGKKIDQYKIRIDNYSGVNGSINYQAYSNLDGWQDIKTSDGISGVSNRIIEAIKINLTGELSDMYNIYYRVHVQDIGWLGWTGNGNPAGTEGLFRQIEAIQIKMQPKDKSDIVISDSAFRESDNTIQYSSHVSDVGWTSYVKNGETSGTTGKSRRVEAYKIKINTKMSGSVNYKSYIAKRGWSSETSNDSISGTTGLSRSIEAVQIKLTGDISNYYNIYYRVHVSNIGWMAWASNGQPAGCLNTNQQIEAIQIVLVNKNASFDGNTATPLVSGSWKNNNTNYYDAFGRKATGFKVIDGVKYYFNSDGKLYGKNVQKVVDVSSWQESINWNVIKNEEDVDAAIIRVGWGTSYNDPCGLDSYYDRNIKEVQRLGIPYGVYIYAYAETTAAAQKEADYVISKMQQYNVPKSTWVWYDAEINSISRGTYNTVIPAFINRMKSQGYNNVGVYGSVSQLDTTNGNLNTGTIRSYPIWVAQYYKNLQYTGSYKGWQFASDERVSGIGGNVDVSMFKK